MNLDTADLKRLSEICLDYYEEQRPYVRSIILYGSSARTYLGEYDNPNDHSF